MTQHICEHCGKSFDTLLKKCAHLSRCSMKLYGLPLTIEENGETFLLCRSCLVYKELDAFTKDKKSPLQKSAYCRECKQILRGTTVPRKIIKQYKQIKPEQKRTLSVQTALEVCTISRTPLIVLENYQEEIDEFKSLGYDLETSDLPDQDAYDTISEYTERIIIISDKSMRFWVTNAFRNDSNQEALNKLVLASA